MGGNVEFSGCTASPLNLKKGESAELRLFLTEVEEAFPTLWNGIDPILFFSGSIGLYYQYPIQCKSWRDQLEFVGDVDIMVDKRREDILLLLFESCFKTATLIGWKKTVNQYVTLWEFHKLRKNIQIDFELVATDPTGTPTKWERWIHSSHPDDAELHLKGFAHKLLMRALTAPTVRDRDIVLHVSNHFCHSVKETGSWWAFSYKGLRVKYAEFEWQGERFFKKVKVQESKFIRNLDAIASFLLLDCGSAKDLDCFVSICKAIKRINDPEWRHQVREGLHKLLFEGQKVSRCETIDMSLKTHVMKMFDELTK